MRQQAIPRYHHATVDARRAAATLVEAPERCHTRGERQECHNFSERPGDARAVVGWPMGGRISSLAFYIDRSGVAAFIMIKRLVTVGTVTGSASRPAKPEKPPVSELRHLCDTVA